MGLYRNEQGGFCLPGTSEDSIVLHRCHRIIVGTMFTERGQTPATEKEHTINAMHSMMHAITWQYECVLG